MHWILAGYRRFACWIGWHGPIGRYWPDVVVGRGCHYRCCWCGRHGAFDSQGNFFAYSEH